jgi:hypothetical protein
VPKKEEKPQVIDVEEDALISTMPDKDTTVEESPSTVDVTKDEKAGIDDVSDILNTIKQGMKDKKASPDVEVKKTEPINIGPDEEIDVRSCTNGGLNWVSKSSGIHYHWLHFNDVQPMKYSDLEYMRRHSGHHIDKPNVIIDDERVIKKYRLMALYTKVAEAMAVENAIGSVEKMTAICKNAKLINMRDLTIDKLTKLIDDGELTNYRVIKAAEEALNYKFDIK